jgi:hypothetical protein
MLMLLSISAPADPQAPVYIQLFSCFDDHLNIEIPDETLTWTLGMVEKRRTANPQSRISVLLQFTGAMSEAMADRNRANGLLDRIIDLSRRGFVDVGYDGTEEPTWRTRPRPNFRTAKTPSERWMARIEPAGWFLTDHKHLLKGYPDASQAGGLKKAVQVFGSIVSVSGYSEELGGDPEYCHQIRTFVRDAILPGLPEPTTWPARDLNGYRGAVEGLGTLVSPGPDFAPELFWQDNFLRLSDTSGPAVRLFFAQEGPEALKKILDQLDRSRIHILRIRLGSPSIHLQPEFEKNLVSGTVRYSYDNPKPARLPEQAFRPKNEIDAGYDREAAVIRWLEEEYFPANPGSRFVSCRDLLQMTAGGSGSAVPRDILKNAAADLLSQWKKIGNHPPAYAAAEGQYFSLAEMFQLLSNALGQFHREGRIPDSVAMLPVYGPIDMTEEEGPSQGTLQAGDLIAVCSDLSDRWSPKAWAPMPENAVPGWITVAGHRLNSAQFLRLMAEAYLAAKRDGEFRIQTSQMQSSIALIFPSSRPRTDNGAAWTIKPARLINQKSLPH